MLEFNALFQGFANANLGVYLIDYLLENREQMAINETVIDELLVERLLHQLNALTLFHQLRQNDYLREYISFDDPET